MNDNDLNPMVGRERELSVLADFANSGKPEFVAVYGRRRVGKTFLIRKAFNDRFAFYTTGIIEGTFEQQLEAFNASLELYGWTEGKAHSWMEAFGMLSRLLKQACSRRTSRQVVFIDELPCFDTQKSGFIPAFDFFWNSAASRINNLMIVVCGSATSWMLKNLIYSHGGLHKRLTGDIALHPFDLYTVEQYCRMMKGKWDRMSILQAYSVFGGIPYYLSLMKFDESVPKNIDRLLFSDNAPLEKEYKALYRSIYSNPSGHMAIVETLAGKKEGMTRAELAKALGVHNNGNFGDMLDNLVNCDFLRLYNNGTMKNGGIYQLVDFFTLFYHTFGKRRTTDSNYWSNMLNSPKQNNFYGLAFERVCLCHFRQIAKALGVSNIHTEFYAWRSRKSDPAAQIDMVIDRSDGIVNLCEMKYSRLPYILTKADRQKIEWREAAFQAENPSRKWTQVVIVTTKGIARNLHSDVAQKELTLDDLFVKM